MPVVELGASIGVVSCLINRLLVDPRSQISVEANPHLIPVLQTHRHRNNCQFQVLHCAIAYESDSVDFGLAENTAASSVATSSETVSTVVVPTRSLDSILRSAELQQCTLVCDIEGAESHLVAHEANVLRDRVHTLIIEVHRNHIGDQGVANIEAKLFELGFTLLWKRGEVWVLRKCQT